MQPRKLDGVMKRFTEVSSCRPFLRGGKEWAHDQNGMDGTMDKLVKVGLFDFKSDVLTAPP